MAAGPAAGAAAAPHTTVQRTIQDCDGDNRLDWAAGEPHVAFGEQPGGDPCRGEGARTARLPNPRSILNFIHLSDFQMVDEESPARVEFFDGTQRGPFNPFSAAYRPQESLTTQVTEAMVRQVREATSPVTGARPQLAILTGDNADSQQYNETRWFIDVLDGTTGDRRRIEPDSGIPVPGCEATPGSVYDGVRDSGDADAPDAGYYEPDESRTDGDGYLPDRARNARDTGRDVTVRDFPGLLEAANAPFEAVGLGMPWYSAFGNHDALVQGNSPEAYFGPGGASPSTETANPVYQEIATGCVKPSNADARAVVDAFAARARALQSTGGLGAPAGLEALLEELRTRMAEQVQAGNAVIVPPDPRRCHVSKDDPPIGAPAPCSTGSWIAQHFVTTGEPAGHGFSNRPPEARAAHDGYYSFTPRPGLRFVVLDTVTDECGSEFCAEGSVDDAQFRWLERELDAAAGAGEYVLTFAHHTLRTTRQPSTDAGEFPLHYGQRVDRENPLNPQNPTGERTLEEAFCARPNLLAHVTGHEHANYVRHHRCAGDQPPTPGPGDFWEISTAAHIDWPQQSRMIELVRDDAGQLALVLTVLDHAGPAEPGGAPAHCPGAGTAACGEAGEQVLRLAGIARELSFNDYQGGRFGGARGERSDRNAILPLGRPFPAR